MFPCDGTPASLTWCCSAKDDQNGECCKTGTNFPRYTIAAILGDPIEVQARPGLSTSGKVGIAIGVVVGVVLVTGVILFAIRVWRWKNRMEAATRAGVYASPTTTLQGSQKDMKPAQLDGMENVVHEAPVIYKHTASPKPQELEGTYLPPTRAELGSPSSPQSAASDVRPLSIQQTPQMMLRTPQRTYSPV